MNTPCTGVSISAVFKPVIEINNCQKQKKKNCNEQDEKINILTHKIFTQLLEDIKQGSIDCFDGHVKDFGCERQALAVYSFVNNEKVKKELEALSEQIQPKKSIDNIHVSDKVAFLARCYFLKHFSGNKQNKEKQWISYIDHEKFNTESELKFSANQMEKFVKPIQSEVSRTSFHFLKKQASRIDSSNNIVEKFPEIKSKDGKYSASNFYSLKTAFQRFEEMKCPFLFKQKADPNENFFSILFNSEKIEETTPVIVIKGAVRADVNAERLTEKIQEIGIQNIIRMTGACIEKSYFEDSEVKEWKKEAFIKECVSEGITTKPKESTSEAIQRIAKEFQVAQPKDTFFDVYHIYCSTIKDEIKQGSIIYGN